MAQPPSVIDAVTRGREAYDRLAWRDAYDHLSAADQQDSLDADDLDRLARAAYLTGHVDAANDVWERTHHAFLDRGETAQAVRCAFWLGLTLVMRGELPPVCGSLDAASVSASIAPALPAIHPVGYDSGRPHDSSGSGHRCANDATPGAARGSQRHVRSFPRKSSHRPLSRPGWPG